jgi:restriction endonuclease S subunit
LKISEIPIDNIDFRIDSEYFSKRYLRFDLFLKNKKSDIISKYAKVSDGDHSKFPDNQIEEVRYLQAKDIKSHFIADSNSVYISREYFDKNKRSHVKEENVILSIMGSVGDIAITPKGFVPTLANRAVAIIKDIKEINPYYLFTYLSTKYGQLQIDRQKNGGVQERINLDVLSKVKIPIIKNEFQKEIETIVKSSHKKRKETKHTYSQAETLLLQEIGLENFEPSKESVNIKNFKESFGVSGRLDAEYYQTKYEIITNAIKSYKSGFSTLESFIENYSTGFPYKSETYSKIEGIPLIRINNISKGNLDLSNATNIPLSDLDLSIKDIANENDILISMSGTIGNSCKIRAGIRAVVNQRIMRISPKNYNVDVLPLIINSIIGQSELERIGTGGVQTNISATDIKEILIPIIEKNKQQQIAELVEESFKLKVESERLLEVAKKAVDMAIEADEATATKFIKDSTI